jgi:membrane protein
VSSRRLIHDSRVILRSRMFIRALTRLAESWISVTVFTMSERDPAQSEHPDKAAEMASGRPQVIRTFLAKGVPAAKRLMRGFVPAVVEIGKRWFLHDHSRSSAALAFYSIFSLVPLLVILTKLAGMMVGSDAAQAEISSASAMFLDEKSTEYVLQLVKQQSEPGWTGWMSLIAFGVLLFTASKVVVELREVLSLIFGVRVREGRRGLLVNQLLKRAVPIILILSLGFVIAISATLGAFFHFLTERIYGGYTDLAVWKTIESVGSGFALALIFTLVLRLLPSVPPSFRAAAGGAIVASVLLAGLRSLMNLYFQHAGVTSVYGAAVTLVVVLIWIYFSVQIFFVGAEVAGYIQRRCDGPDRAPK